MKKRKSISNTKQKATKTKTTMMKKKKKRSKSSSLKKKSGNIGKWISLNKLIHSSKLLVNKIPRDSTAETFLKNAIVQSLENTEH